MQPWSVATFAANLGVEVRKLNCLFYKNYGVSAKQWLLEQRLIYARQQLITTDKKLQISRWTVGLVITLILLTHLRNVICVVQLRCVPQWLKEVYMDISAMVNQMSQQATRSAQEAQSKMSGG